MFLNRISKCRSLLNSNRLIRRCFILPATKDKEAILPFITQKQQQEENNTESWNNVMSQLANNGRSAQAQQVYDSVFRSHGTLANINTFYQLMLAYINNYQYNDAMEIYFEIRDHEAGPSDNIKNLQLDEEMYNQLVKALAEKSKTSEKRQFIEDENAIYGSTLEDDDDYFDNEESQPELLAALSLLKDMRQLDMTPTNAMYISLLEAGGHHKDPFVVHRVHKLIRMDPYFDPDNQLYVALMKAYHSIGEADVVLDLWDRYRLGLDIVVQTCQKFNFQQRLQHVWEQCRDQFSNEQTNTLIEMVAKHNIEQAKKLWKEAVENGKSVKECQ